MSRVDRRKRSAGFSYVEVLVAIVLISIAVVPAIEGLSAGIRSAGAVAEGTEMEFRLASWMEKQLARSFNKLDAEAQAVGDPTVATSFSDDPGTERRRLVYLSRYDGDNADADDDPFTGGDDGLIWVKVQIENTSLALEALTAR